MLDIQARLDKLETSRHENDSADLSPADQLNSQDFCASDEFFDLKSRIHDKLSKTINLSLLEEIDEAILKSEIKKTTEDLLSNDQDAIPINFLEREILIREIYDEVVGLGPLEPLLKDPTISDILVNTYKQVYVERYGKLEPTRARFQDDEHLMRIIERIVSAVGRRIDEMSPMVDARLADGSRVNAIIPPLALDGPSLSIRRFSVDPLQVHDLVVLKTLTPQIGELLQGIVGARLNVLVSGGTGSGKTTLLNILSGFISADERIVTIEDSAELQLRQDHVVRLETRPANIEGKGQITQQNLLINALRMRPDRIVVGEVRGAEAVDMLQAMNTGHDGSLTTVHANSAVDALMRLETMVNMAGFNLPSHYIKKYISSAIDVVVHADRLVDGSRKIMSLQEITGMEGDVITMQEIFSFEQTGIGKDGIVMGDFESKGIRPKFMEKFAAMGIKLSQGIFDFD